MKTQTKDVEISFTFKMVSQTADDSCSENYWVGEVIPPDRDKWRKPDTTCQESMKPKDQSPKCAAPVKTQNFLT